MKKQLIKSMLSVLIFSLTIMTVLFVFIENHQYIENIKHTLETNDRIIINSMETYNGKNKAEIFKDYFKNTNLRGTYIDKDGNVISDSEEYGKKLENHNGRKEVIDARKYGTGYNIRLSDTTKKRTLYFAIATKDGHIVRTAMTMNRIEGIEIQYFKYYVFIMIMSIIISMFFAIRLSNYMVKPVKKLQEITAAIANGDLNRRVKINRDDEIGKLAKTFNNMGEKLQYTLNESMEQNNKLQAILTSMDSGVIAIDINYRIIMINPYARKIFGINENIIGNNLMDSIRNFELEDIFKEEKKEHREIKIIWPRERNLRIKTADIINDSNNKIGTVAVVQDITDIKRLENMRSEFVANVSHELKTPLTSIKGFSETLKYVDDDENKNKFLNIINDEADRLTRLIDDILTLSHIENYKNFERERINIKEVIENVCYLMKDTAKKKNIEIKSYASDVLNICGNKDRFKQMLLNLVDNAVKYSNEGGLVEVGNKLEGKNHIIWVKDNGVGISKEHQERLFERFYRVDKARSRRQGGTGLGLAIVKHIVMEFNGTIKIDSKVGMGSKFTVFIPVSKKDL
ncbi:HAMP domain-containing protein [Clostridium sp. cel8]|uniref:two-component system histidine kinase PnpS n=1 Tax=unclassified Clostridium TaxID=2614128 RepID=UPI0015F73499|nr:HAMP domain-containing sensor histidine kinase [Clostridium sp. cel8]MBA5850543.1 HAMP domain-containing protein [Clostridium sp. cel8]